MNFTFERLKIPDVILIKPKPFKDDRGFFLESYKASVFKDGGISDTFVQDNHSRSSQGILRGLHYQKEPKAHSKLVSVVRGEILDVAVDIRKGSPTYGQWVSAVLSEDNHHQLFVPLGFAHGFYVLSKTADVTYKISSEYAGDHDRGIAWNDPTIGIDWGTASPILSERDKVQPSLDEADNNFSYKEAS